MFISPMLTGTREEPFDDERFVFEPKIDGHRLLLSLEPGRRVQLFTRHGNEVTRQYPELQNVPVDGGGVILDGEAAYVNPDTGQVEFETLMERFRMTKIPKIREARQRIPVRYFVFDVLQYNGRDLRSRPLTERRKILDEILTENAYYSRVLQVDGRGNELFDLIRQRGLEGIVAKEKYSRYVSRRSDRWQKVINYQTAIVELGGYRKHQFGWLAQVDGRPAGMIELAVPAGQRKAFHEAAKKLATGEDRNYVYIEPRLRAKVRFRNWTKAGMLRSPEFVEFVEFVE
ncbi:ATP-dependent DNA ligase [Paenibacillus humicola]|uniref:ATP-dependent DNA ligase n=1 Tax=Paenibacillus humicola TaxID=3110540 RepID=UPI00237A3CB0|nr:ATP-dependent DNA ligase [Paenibacillus humicola]